MKERPILFSGEMVRAILKGRKTQTRRVVKKIPCQCSDWIPDEISKTTPEGFQEAGHSGLWSCQSCTDLPIACPYGQPGDRMWVRETWKLSSLYKDDPLRLQYKADGGPCGDSKIPWQPSIFMPRWASRITLEIVNIRVERVQEISEEDAWNEGVGGGDLGKFDIDGRVLFKSTWDEINGKRGYGWDQNPWVWVIEFKRVDDQGGR